MRSDAPFLVKRYAPMMGRPTSFPRRISIAHQAYTLESALLWACSERNWETRPDAPDWQRDAALFWVERRHQSAARSRERRA